MNKKEMLLNFTQYLKGGNKCKGMSYLFHLVENSNREFSYIALFQAVNHKVYKEKMSLPADLQIKQCDARAIKEVHHRIFKINTLIANGDSHDDILIEKESLEHYLHEVVDHRYIKYFHDEQIKCRKSIKEVVRLCMKKIHTEQPKLHETVKHCLVQRWNSIGMYI